MKKDIKGGIKTIADFLGKTLTADKVQKVAEHCSFQSMKENPSTNLSAEVKDFMRKGQVGDWQNHFSNEQNEKMDEYIRRHFSESDLSFVYDL